MYEYTVVLIKPDGVAMGEKVISSIKKRYKRNGLTIREEQRLWLTEKQAAEFYIDHEGKSFFDSLIQAMTSGPLTALILGGNNAISVARKLNGSTDPTQAEPGTIRHDFRSTGGPYNTVHASDNLLAVEHEIFTLFDSSW